MNFNESLVFYLVVGFAVAVAYVLVERPGHAARSWFGGVAACLFWPLYLPLVLTSQKAPVAAAPRVVPRDELTTAIEQVERELDAALSGLDGWAENVLHQKTDRLRELRSALVAQADRIRDMEALLARESNAAAPLEHLPGTDSKPAPANERWERSWQARQENMARLARLSRQARSDLLATLAWIRELVSMIHLAKFTGAPAARAEELVAQIAAAVESISSLSAREASPDTTAAETNSPFLHFVPGAQA